MTDRFKVVENAEGRTANHGVWPKDTAAPTGLPRAEADSDCAMRNAKAEKLGIAARYEVQPL